MKYFTNKQGDPTEIRREEAVQTQERSKESNLVEQYEGELMKTSEADEGGVIGRPVI